MRTSLTSRGASWRRFVAAAAVVALPFGIVATTGGAASAHEAPGSPFEVFIDQTGSASLADAIQNGWWGHEGAAGGTGTAPSILDFNSSDADFAGTFSNLDNVRVAFATTSANGSAEHPAVTAGQTADQVFGWFMDAGLQQSLNGNTNPNDSVNTVSTGAEYDAWFAAGAPLQGYNNSLQLLDVSAPGQPVSATPQGKSILNRWATGSNISLVFYESTGATVNGKPVVKVGSDGHAITAYMPFTTVAKPGDALRTSAGYNSVDFGAVAQNTNTTLATSVPSPQASGTSIDLTATVAPASGTDVPVGSVTFKDGAATLGTGTLSGGVAHLNGQVLAVGNHSLTAVYAPTNTQTLAFNPSTSTPATSYVITATSTSTAAGATPGADYTQAVTLTGQVAPSTPGSITWSEAGSPIAGPVAVDGTGFASATHTFSVAGSHTVVATFTPTSSSFAASSGSVTFSLAVPAGVSTDDQAIQATIPVGTITVTTPYTPASPLDLGTLTLTPALDGYLGSATFNGISVVDTRSGAQPWGLTALAGALTDGGGHFINGQNVGLTALVAGATSNPGLGTITTFNNPVPAAPVAPSASGNLGLGGIPHTVLSANQGPSNVLYSGTLSIFAPTTTTTGLYKGTITFTAS